MITSISAVSKSRNASGMKSAWTRVVEPRMRVEALLDRGVAQHLSGALNVGVPQQRGGAGVLRELGARNSKEIDARLIEKSQEEDSPPEIGDKTP